MQNSSFKSIADTLHKDPATISKEVGKNAKLIVGKHVASHCGKCHHLSICDILGNDIVASNYNRSSYCKNLCKKFRREYPPRTCTLYTPFKCNQGINLNSQELSELNDLICPLILKGQPLSHIFAVHAEEIPVCRRTLYNSLDQ